MTSEARVLSKPEAEKIAQITSSIFQQGPNWVLREWDLEKGTERLTRGLSLPLAKKKLKSWRRERVEELLRANRSSSAYTLRVWRENPLWGGQGIWQWSQNFWYTTREDAEKALEKKKEAKKETDQEANVSYEIHEIKIEELPGHFSVA